MSPISPTLVAHVKRKPSVKIKLNFIIYLTDTIYKQFL
jgi:hypothetical protein